MKTLICLILITQTTIDSSQLPPLTIPRNSLTTSDRYHVGNGYMLTTFLRLNNPDKDPRLMDKAKLRKLLKTQQNHLQCYLAKPYSLYVPQQTLPAYTQTKTAGTQQGRK